jgi:hypothetical protein
MTPASGMPAASAARVAVQRTVPLVQAGVRAATPPARGRLRAHVPGCAPPAPACARLTRTPYAKRGSSAVILQRWHRGSGHQYCGGNLPGGRGRQGFQRLASEVSMRVTDRVVAMPVCSVCVAGFQLCGASRPPGRAPLGLLLDLCRSGRARVSTPLSRGCRHVKITPRCASVLILRLRAVLNA